MAEDIRTDKVDGRINLDQIEKDEFAYQEEIRLAKEEAIKVQLLKDSLKLKAGQDYGFRKDFINQLKEIEAGIEEAHANQILERLAEANALRNVQKNKQDELDGLDMVYVAAQEALKRIEKLMCDADPEKGVSHGTEEAYEIVKKDYDEVVKNQADIKTEIEKINIKLISDETSIKYNALIESQKKLRDELRALEENPNLAELLVEESTTEKELRQEVKNALFREITGELPKERINFIDKIVDQFLGEEFESRGIDDLKEPYEKMAAKKVLAKDIINYLPYKNPKQLINGEGIDNFYNKKGNIYTAKLLQNLVGNFSDANETSKFMVRVELGEGEAMASSLEHRKALAKVITIHLGTLNLIRATKFGIDKVGKGNIVTIGFNDEKNSKLKRLENDLRESFAFKIDINGGPILPLETSLAKENKIKKDYEIDMKAGQELAIEMFNNQENIRLEKINSIEREIDSLKKTAERIKLIDNKLAELGDSGEKKVKIAHYISEIAAKEALLKDNQLKLSKAIFKSSLNAERVKLIESKNMYESNIKLLQSKIENINHLSEERINLPKNHGIDSTLAELQDKLEALKV
jgi:hypothetical protein